MTKTIYDVEFRSCTAVRSKGFWKFIARTFGIEPLSSTDIGLSDPLPPE